MCPIILTCMLALLLAFAALVRARGNACEAGPYHAPLESPEAWSASLDVDLGLDLFSDEGVDNGWDMVPTPTAVYMYGHSYKARVRTTRRTVYTLVSLRETCMC